MVDRHARGVKRGNAGALTGPFNEDAIGYPLRALASKRTTAALVVALLSVLALVTRLAGIGFFLPHSHEPDALVFLTQYRAYAKDDPEPWRDPYWGYYPHLISRLASLAPVDLPAPQTEAEHELAAVAEQIHLRRLVALLSVLAVPGTYLLARRFLQREAALLAAGLMAASLLHLWFAQQARPHAASMAFALAAVLAHLRMRRRPDAGSYALSALASAGAISALNNGLAVLVPFVAAHLLRERSGSRRSHLWFVLALFVVALSIPIAYPFLLAPKEGSAIPPLHIDGTLPTVAGQTLRLESFGGGFRVMLETLENYEPLILALAVLGLATGVVLLVRAGRGGSPSLGWRRLVHAQPELLVVLSYVIPYALVVGLYAHTYQRFVIPLLPYLAVLAAFGIHAAAALFTRSAWLPRTVALAAFAAQACAAGKLAWIRTQPDTHALAGRWIRAHARPALDRILVSPRVDLPVWRTREALDSIPSYYARLFPWVEHQRQAQMPPAGEPLYDVRALRVLGADVSNALDADPSAYLRAQPFDILVLEITDFRPSRSGERLREGARQIAEPMARFGPIDDPSRDDAWLYYQDDYFEHPPCWWLEVLRAKRFGPTLEIYRVRDAPR